MPSDSDWEGTAARAWRVKPACIQSASSPHSNLCRGARSSEFFRHEVRKQLSSSLVQCDRCKMLRPIYAAIGTTGRGISCANAMRRRRGRGIERHPLRDPAVCSRPPHWRSSWRGVAACRLGAVQSHFAGGRSREQHSQRHKHRNCCQRTARLHLRAKRGLWLHLHAADVRRESLRVGKNHVLTSGRTRRQPHARPAAKDNI